MHIFTAIVVNRIVVDKRTLKGAFYEMKNDYLGGIALDDQWWAWTEYGYAACMDPGDLLDLIEERLADPKIPTDTHKCSSLHHPRVGSIPVFPFPFWKFGRD